MIKAVVIGTSAGGIEALDFLLPHLPSYCNVPVIVVQHISATSDSFYITLFDERCKLAVKEATSGESVMPGKIYFAPPNFHLGINEDFTFVLEQGPKINYSRPSIDYLFHSAANVYKKDLLGIILTGANNDGSEGLKKIKELGGLVFIQNPSHAHFPEMPLAAIRTVKPDAILTLNELAQKLMEINEL
jgi:two-component system, chemotaxis family, protein-glutamate methylesterase/glutaminase